MSDEKALPRPPQVTAGACLALSACVLLVVAAFEAMGSVGSPDTRALVADYLRKPPGSGFGVTVAQGVSVLRVAVFVDAALAAMGAVLAVFVLQRHRGARIVLTVAGLVLVLTAWFSGGVLPLVLVAATVLLWSAPARDWFAGRPPRQAPADASTGRGSEAWASQGIGGDAGRGEHRPAPVRAEEDRPADGLPAPSPYPFGSTPAPQQAPYGQPVHGAPQPPPGAWQVPPPGSYGAPDPGRRPGSVTAAAVITWVLSGLTVLLYVLMLAVLLAAKDQILTAVRENPEVARTQINGQDLIAILWVVGVVFVFWCLASIVLAFLAYRRMGWARVLLAVSAGVAALVALVTFLTFPLALVVLAGAVATIVLLFVPASNDWFAGRPPRSLGGAPGGYGGGYPYPYGQQQPGPSGQQQGEQPPPQRDERDNVW